MSETPIEHVSDTALWVADYRARETRRSDALFRDPFAEILAGERGERIARRMRNEVVMSWAIALRTRITDEFITEAIADGVDTVLNLGAGLDARPYRMEIPPTLRWVEIDYPHMIEFKEERLRDEKPRCRLERIALDLSDIKGRREHFTNLNRQSNRLLVLTEGVTPYLANEQVESLADDLRKQENFRYWVLDYHSSAAAVSFGRKQMKRNLRNAPMQFRPPEWVAFFSGHGWEVKQIRYFVEEAERLKRPLRLPWGLKLLKIFLSKARQQTLRRMAGVAMLLPRPQ